MRILWLFQRGVNIAQVDLILRLPARADEDDGLLIERNGGPWVLVKLVGDQAEARIGMADQVAVACAAGEVAIYHALKFDARLVEPLAAFDLEIVAHQEDLAEAQVRFERNFRGFGCGHRRGLAIERFGFGEQVEVYLAARARLQIAEGQLVEGAGLADEGAHVFRVDRQRLVKVVERLLDIGVVKRGCGQPRGGVAHQHIEHLFARAVRPVWHFVGGDKTVEGQLVVVHGIARQRQGDQAEGLGAGVERVVGHAFEGVGFDRQRHAQRTTQFVRPHQFRCLGKAAIGHIKFRLQLGAVGRLQNGPIDDHIGVDLRRPLFGMGGANFARGPLHRTHLVGCAQFIGYVEVQPFEAAL